LDTVGTVLYLLKVEKVHNFYTFMPISFLVETF
jgi:hypothetical protein